MQEKGVQTGIQNILRQCTDILPAHCNPYTSVGFGTAIPIHLSTFIKMLYKSYGSVLLTSIVGKSSWGKLRDPFGEA